jgi:hypothetical protein
MKNFLFKLFGIISLGLAILGIFLPILPTTPFLLLSSFLFMRSSDKLHKWLIEHKIFGQYIKDFQEEKAIPLKVKISSISFLWITILLSVFFFIEKLWVELLLISIAIGVTIHILQYKTKK